MLLFHPSGTDCAKQTFQRVFVLFYYNTNLYNIVDQIFIANASYLGSYGNAANTVVFPLTVVALAIAVMIGDGCCAFVSISLGQNEVSKARRSAKSKAYYYANNAPAS